ncbi:MAG: ferritin family protein [Thermoanaerobaculales bacterium]|nr:ferritin family protein [Thermoanaerobaculales bacterium]
MHDKIREVLKKAYQIEVDGYTFYSMVADRAEKAAVRELFEKLARDEVQHKAFITGVMGSYEDRGVEAFNIQRRDPALKAFSDTIYTEAFRAQARDAEFEMGVLSIGMTLETRAIQYFSGAARSATEAEVRDFYQFLADWEKGHLEALQRLYGGVRETAWAEGGFSPF